MQRPICEKAISARTVFLTSRLTNVCRSRSDKTALTEYYDLFQDPNGDNWFTVTTIVTDPVYLYTPFVTTTDFKKEADGRKFSPAPCAAR